MLKLKQSGDSLFDFLDIEDADIMKRANIFNKFVDNAINLKHYYYRRVSNTGSGPVMNVYDQYSGQNKDMIYLASNDYLNLTRHPRVIAAGIKAIQKYGAGARICG